MTPAPPCLFQFLPVSSRESSRVLVHQKPGFLKLSPTGTTGKAGQALRYVESTITAMMAYP